MTVLVTGSNGFIGSYLVEKLLDLGYHVKCLVRKTSNLQWLKELTVEYVYGDLSNPATIAPAIEGVQVIYHLAGVTKAKSEEEYIQGNYQTTLNLINTIKQKGNPDQKLVFVSSQAAGGPGFHDKPRTEDLVAMPVSSYGKAKLLAENAVLDFCHTHQAVIIRPPSVYGPRDRDVYLMFKYIQKGILPVVGGGKQKVSMIHVFDLIDGIVLAANDSKANGKIYYISGDEEYDWEKIGHLIGKALNKNYLTLSVPYFCLDILSLTSQILSKCMKKTSIINKDKFTEIKQVNWLCKNQRAKDELGFNSKMSLEEGIVSTAQWYKKMGWLKE